MAETLTKRKLQALETKEKIQSAALRLFGEKGVEAVSMEEIAEAAGCSVGNIYHYFKGKEALNAAITHFVDAHYRELEGRYFAEGGEVAGAKASAKLIDFSVEALRIDSKEELLFQSMAYSLKSPEQRILRFDNDEVYPSIIRRITEEMAAEGLLKEGYTAENIFDLFVTMNRGILLEWRIEEGGFDIEERGRLMAEALIGGVCK